MFEENLMSTEVSVKYSLTMLFICLKNKQSCNTLSTRSDYNIIQLFPGYI